MRRKVSIGRWLRAMMCLLALLALPAYAQDDDRVGRLVELYQQATTLQAENRYDEAASSARAMIELAEAIGGPDHPDVGAGLLLLGQSQEALGGVDAAITTYTRAAGIGRLHFGDTHPLTLNAWNALGRLLLASGDAEGAVGYNRSVHEGLVGNAAATDLDRAAAAENLAESLAVTGGIDEAEALYRQALSMREQAAGDDQAALEPALRKIADFLSANGRREASVPYYRRLLAISTALRGERDAQTSIAMNNLALVLQDLQQYGEAEELLRAALDIDRALLDRLDTDLALAHANLAGVLSETGQHEQAERHHREALAIREEALGPDDPLTAVSLNDLGLLLWTVGRLEVAEALMRRALAIRSAALGEEDAATAQSAGNLGLILSARGEHEQAAALHRQALAVNRVALGPDHPDTSKSINNLAVDLEALGEYDQAIELFRQALEIDERTSGAMHPNTATALNNLADSLAMRGDFASLTEAGQLSERALAIREAVLGDGHPDTISSLDSLATVVSTLGLWGEAAPLFERAVALQTDPANRSGIRAISHMFAAAAANAMLLDPEQAGTAAFETVQWPMGGQASAALAATAARLAAREPELVALVRRRQDAEERHGELLDAILSAHGAGDDGRARALRSEADELSALIAGLDDELARRFPRFASLNSGEPLPVGAVVPLLRRGEALVLVVPGHVRRSGFRVAGSAFVVRWDGAVHAAMLEPGYGIQLDIARLRCSIDRDSSSDCVRRLGGEGGTETGTRGAVTLVAGVSPGGFDLGLAHDLHGRMLGPLEEALEGVEHLIFVGGDDSLANLPLQLLVTEAPDPALMGADALREARWLIRDMALSTLPSVASLAALREVAPAAAAGSRRFLGVGDPVIGRGGPMRCADEDAAPVRVALAQEVTGGLVRSAGDGVTDVEAVRALSRLPDTRCELEAIAATLGGGTLLLDAMATETELKRLDDEGELADHRILAFATHGLTAGAIGGGEPALVLTPPTAASALDDGLLTASEIAALSLDADWVILSACDTAAGQESGGESLSGLARAFFYAGSRSLMVSHWPVVSSAAVRITTGAFDRLARSPEIGRAEAVRQSLVAMLDDPSSGEAELHPRYWAPFSLVGEGGSVARR